MECTAVHVLSWPAIVFIMFFDRLSYLVCTYDFYIFVLVCVFWNTIVLYAAHEACEAHV